MVETLAELFHVLIGEMRNGIKERSWSSARAQAEAEAKAEATGEVEGKEAFSATLDAGPQP